MFGFKHGRLGSAGTRTLIQRAIASLRARGTDAHLWLPGGDVKTYGPELVTNGTFDANINGWTAQYTSTANWQAGALRSVSSGINAGACSYPITCVVNKGYKLAGNILGGSHTGRFSVSASATLADPVFISAYTTPATPVTGYFVATATTMYVGAELGSGNLGAYNDFDNISVREITSQTSAILNGLTTGNYLESTGNSVATVDNPTGLVLDALGTVGVELAGAVDLTSPLVQGQYIGGAVGIPVTSPSGKYFKIVYTISASSYSGDFYHEQTGGCLPYAAYAKAVGTWSYIIKADDNDAKFNFLLGGALGQTGSITFSAFSVREVSGIHLTQGTTANKPLLRRGLVNLLTYSKTVGGTSWALLGGLTSSGLVTAPDGTNTANTFLVSGSAYLQHNISGFASGASGTVAIWAKQSASGAANGIRLTTNNASAWSTGISQYFPLTPTWQLIVLSGVLQTGGASTTISYGAQLADASSDPNCYGNVDLVDAGCFLGTYTAAQILAAGGIPVTTTAAASNPDSGKYSWSFDGSNDSLALGSVPFQMEDDHCVIAGIQPASSVNDGYVFNPASGAGTQMVGCLLVTSAGYAKAAWWDDTTLTAITDTVGRANTTFVASAVKVENDKRLRVNGTQSGATETTPMGTTTVTGGSIGTYSPIGGNKYLGSIGPVLAIKGTVTDAELLMYERLVAALTPGAPTF